MPLNVLPTPSVGDVADCLPFESKFVSERLVSAPRGSKLPNFNNLFSRQFCLMVFFAPIVSSVSQSIARIFRYGSPVKVARIYTKSIMAWPVARMAWFVERCVGEYGERDAVGIMDSSPDIDLTIAGCGMNREWPDDAVSLVRSDSILDETHRFASRGSSDQRVAVPSQSPVVSFAQPSTERIGLASIHRTSKLNFTHDVPFTNRLVREAARITTPSRLLAL